MAIHDHPHEALDERLDELEEQLEGVEHEATAPLVPNHDHHELARSVEALRADLTAVQHELVNIPRLAPDALESVHARIADLEVRLEDATERVTEPVQESAEEALEIPEEIVVPKKRHWFHGLPRIM